MPRTIELTAELMAALSLVYALAEGNQLTEDEADSPELICEMHRQERALEIVCNLLQE